MWKIAIIDDDRQVLLGMKKTIPWKELNAEWIGEGMDGEQGLALIRSHKPDIVITDIYMPIMNGLEMVEELMKENFQGKVIILSGYSDFEYARQALRLNVDDYLLKPITLQTLQRVLERVIVKLEVKMLEETGRGKLREEEAFGETYRLAMRPVKFYRQLGQAVQHSQENLAQEIIREFVDQLKEQEHLAPTYLQQLGRELWTVFVYALYDVGVLLDEMAPGIDLDKELAAVTSAELLSDWLTDKVRLICGNQQWNENLKHKQAVEFMVEYIHEHYAEEITLNDLAEKVFISRNYLSHIFKKATGESFNRYLTKVRMEKAKEMILEGKYLIYEIAERVGYRNVPYFSTLFKKETGFNPTDLIK